MTRTVRTTFAISVIASMLFAASFAVPAMGGPSLGKVYTTAKKALRTAKQAKRSASTANSRALTAQGRASTAQSRADSAYALAGQANARVQITVVRSAEVTVAPSTAGGAEAICPSGQRVISGGGAFVSGADAMSITDTTNDRSRWYVIGYNSAPINATVEATALCAPSGQAVAANRGAARAEVAQALRGVARAAKRCSSGYTHAVMPGGAHKCLRAGQFCSRSLASQRVYHRLGFHCKTNGHLSYR
jgi:hypothetical protein